MQRNLVLAHGDLAAVASPCGLHLAANWNNRSILALLMGREVYQVDQEAPHVWVIDNMLVELHLVPAAEMEAGELRGTGLLDFHRKWELSWTAQQKGWGSLESEVFKSGPPENGANAQAQVWSFAAPEPFVVHGKNVRAMSYATVAVDDVVLVVATPHPEGQDPRGALRLFLSLFTTITLQEGAPDVGALQAAILREAETDPRCDKVLGKPSSRGP